MLKATAIAHFNGLQNLAKALKVSESAIYQWPDLVPPATAMELEQITEGKLPVDPNVYIRDARAKRRAARATRRRAITKSH